MISKSFIQRIINSLGIFLFSILNLSAQQIQYSIGDAWTYERTNDRLKETYFEAIEVTDTLSINNRSCYVLDRGLFYQSDTICVEDEKVYFWDDDYKMFQLQYDYGADSVFTAEYVSDNVTKTYDVYVDSIRQEETANGLSIDVHYLRSHWGYGGLESTRRSYRGIGQDRHHPRYTTGGLIFDEFELSNRVLRCFQQDSTIYRFVDYPCDTTWIFPDTMDLANTIFSIGDTWTYEKVLIPNPLRYNPINYAIEDIVIWNGVVAFDLSGTYMFEKDKQIYFWDEGLNRYIKYYDFSGNLSSYTINYLEEGEIGTYDLPAECQVTIDSITSRIDSLNVSYDIQNVTFDCIYNDRNGNLVEKLYNDEIIVNVGHHLENPRIILSNRSVDPPYFYNGIRCFTNDSLGYQFKPYPCDTVFSEIRISTEEILNNEISIVPNPNSGYFNVVGLEQGAEYKIYDAKGSEIKSGTYPIKGIELTDKGLFIISGEVNGVRWSKKIVVN